MNEALAKGCMPKAGGHPIVARGYDCNNSSLTVKVVNKSNLRLLIISHLCFNIFRKSYLQFPSVAIARQFSKHCEDTPFKYRGAKVLCAQMFVPGNPTSKVQLHQVNMPFDKVNFK